jgi:hypothetical protein
MLAHHRETSQGKVEIDTRNNRNKQFKMACTNNERYHFHQQENSILLNYQFSIENEKYSTQTLIQILAASCKI